MKIRLIVLWGIMYTFAQNNSYAQADFEHALWNHYFMYPMILCTAGSAIMNICSHPDSCSRFPARDNIMDAQTKAR